MKFTFLSFQQVQEQVPVPVPEPDSMSSGMTGSMETTYPKFEERIDRVCYTLWYYCCTCFTMGDLDV